MKHEVVMRTTNGTIARSYALQTSQSAVPELAVKAVFTRQAMGFQVKRMLHMSLCEVSEMIALINDYFFLRLAFLLDKYIPHPRLPAEISYKDI